jgi:hypothetical protein
LQLASTLEQKAIRLCGIHEQGFEAKALLSESKAKRAGIRAPCKCPQRSRTRPLSWYRLSGSSFPQLSRSNGGKQGAASSNEIENNMQFNHHFQEEPFA